MTYMSGISPGGTDPGSANPAQSAHSGPISVNGGGGRIGCVSRHMRLDQKANQPAVTPEFRNLCL
jgi:hypothetical protein